MKDKAKPHIVIFVEGDTDEIFFNSLISFYKANSVTEVASCEVVNLRGVARYSGKVTGKLKNEICPKAEKRSMYVKAVCCSYDTDVFEFVSFKSDYNLSYDSNINVVSVYSYSNVTLLNYLIGKINKNATISKTNEYEVTDYNLVYTSGVIQKKVSIYNSIISGYKEAGYDNIIDENSFKGYIIHTLTTFAPNELKIGDVITKFNGIDLAGLTGENEFEKILEKTYYENKTYPITVIRNENINGEYVTKKYDFEIKTNYFFNKEDGRYVAFGIYTYEYIIPNSNGDFPEYSWEYGDSIGPSGGLMQSLYVYEELTNSYLTKNKKIVGTGTVDAYGNAGAIGGIYQKVITAYLSGADIFFVPVNSMDPLLYQNESNYIEAKESYDKLNNPKMKLVVVSSLDDIIYYLKNN